VQTLGSVVRTTIPDLLPNRGVNVRVAAGNSAGTGEYSEYVQTTTLPKGPSLVYVSDIFADAAMVHWINADGADGRYHYRVYPFYRDGQEIKAQQAIVTTPGPLDKWLVTGLARGTTYFFRVCLWPKFVSRSCKHAPFYIFSHVCFVFHTHAQCVTRIDIDYAQ
jgi:hypothetical protein